MEKSQLETQLAHEIIVLTKREYMYLFNQNVDGMYGALTPK